MILFLIKSTSNAKISMINAFLVKNLNVDINIYIYLASKNDIVHLDLHKLDKIIQNEGGTLARMQKIIIIISFVFSMNCFFEFLLIFLMESV